jgi:signal transduction histidine kinase
MKRRDVKESARLLGEIIDETRGEIEQRWLRRVQEDVARCANVEITQLRDGLPDYLKALAVLLRKGEERELEMGEQTWSDIAREHGVMRVRIGFDITELIREFVVLRHVIRGVLEEKHALGGGPDTESLLTDLLDGAITAAVRAYVEARDYDARRAHAEQVAFLTHELRNPLSSAMLSAAQLRGRATTDEVRHLLDVLDRSHHRLEALIDGVLLTKRLEAGDFECKPTTLKLGQLMETALEAARAVASKKGVDFHVEYDPEIEVEMDPALTRSAVQNLADNAAKYTDSGHVDVTVNEREDELEIHVRDNCLGISPEELKTVFEPFKRGTTGKSGSGLGLAIARRAIEAQGGSIHAESSDQPGCHFWISLPKSVPERAKRRQQESAAS